MEELGERGGKEEALERQEEGNENPGEDLLAALFAEVEEEQHGRAHHGDSDGEAVCGFHMRRALEQQDDDDATDHHDVVDHGDIELALGLRRVENLHVRHEVEAARLGYQRERARDKRLRCDDCRERREGDGERAHTRGKHLEERVEIFDVHERRVALVEEQPCALSQVGENQADLNERPGAVDVAAADVAHVGVERLGAGGGEEAAAENHDARVIVGRKQEHDAANRVEGEQHDGVLDDEHETRDAEEQEPERHDRAERAADFRRADALDQKQNDDDCERDDDDLALIVAQKRVHGGNGAQALDSGRDGDGRGQDSVGEKSRAAEHGGHDKPRGMALDQAIQCKDAALAMVVGAHANEHVLDSRKQRDRPDDERKRAENELLGNAAESAVAGDERLGYVHGARADIAVNDTEGHKHRRQADGDGVRGCFRCCSAFDAGFFTHEAPFFSKRTDYRCAM